MTKALIISDIHANIIALEAIWARESDSDIVYCVGDIVDYGVFPNQAIAWMREHNAICVQGNHDREVIATYREPNLHRMPDHERRWRHYTAQQLDSHEIAFLEQLPLALDFVLDGIHYGMTHMVEDYQILLSLHAYATFCAERFPTVAPAALSRLIFGHTHRRCIYILSDTAMWLNPGSISYRRPDDPDQHAHYSTIIDGVIDLKQVAYDCRPSYETVLRTPLVEDEARVARWYFEPREQSILP